MKKKAFNLLLLAAMVFGMTITVSSCKDNDDDNKSEEQKEQEAQVKSSNFWSVVGQLVSIDDVTDDYEGKTFEPTYGLPDGTNATTRIVNTNDMRTAAQRFANLIDVKGIDENTPSYTWSDPEIGSMTYTRGGTSAEWATVDVDIKAVPRLQRIIYRVGGEGENGTFEGKAYYRFGDVVSRQVTVKYDQKKNNDGRGTITEYWICVRPSFGPEGKEDSHWVCINTVSDQNYKYYKASTGAEYWLPTSLKVDKENMQNFAEMLWAICYPEMWWSNVFNHHTDGKLWGFDGVPFFTDFKKANLKYHNEAFWYNVQNGWIKNKVVENVLNLPAFFNLSETVKDGIHLLYKGYSWWFSSSWDCQLWEAVYSNGTKDEELNMHHAVYNDDLEKNMKGLKFDVRKMGNETANYNDYFNDGKYRWAIRHATGKELADNKKYDVKQAISGVKEVYRYYKEYADEWNKKTTDNKPEIPEKVITPGDVKVGYIIGSNGKFYEKYKDAISIDDNYPVAMVCYNAPIKASNNITYHFLAIALQPADMNATHKWGTHMSSCATRIDIDRDFNTLTTTYCGLLQTKAMANEGQELHPAAWQCQNYMAETFLGEYTMRAAYDGYSPSQWFLPSAGEWTLFLKGLNVWDLRDGNKILNTIQNVYAGAGIDSNAAGVVPNFPNGVWTCVEASEEQAYVLKIDAQSAARFEKTGKNVAKQVFPFIYY